MNNYYNSPRSRHMAKAKRRRRIITRMTILLLIIAAIVAGVIMIVNAINDGNEQRAIEEQKASMEERIDEFVKEADFLAAGYDYDAAIEKIESFGEDYSEHEALTTAILKYEVAKAATKRYEDVTKITHVFFHTLVVDNAKCFDGDAAEGGYNQYMTTISEFNAMLEEMYKRGFVLVSLHDIAVPKTGADGITRYVPGDIMLPPGKEPFVMSQDDVSYYEYMETDGFARKIVIGKDNMPTCEYVLDDGTVVTGDYDLVPLLEKFIQEHPDFSYRGARAALALTGYEGVLGYRTEPSYDNWEAEAEEAKKVADRMKECGWEFASHSWGHIRYGDSSYSRMLTDVEKWDTQVRPIVGDTDLMIFANGADIGGVGKYSGEKYDLLYSKGFRFFCNVDAAQYWVQIHDEYVRQGRRNLDGYRMWYGPDKLTDLFNVEDVWDSDRPTPVPPIG